MAEIVITNAPAEVDWTIKRGDTFLKEFEIREGEGEGDLVDLTGSSFVMTIVDNRGTPLETLTLGSGITVISAGVLQLHATAAQTGAWTDNCGAMFTLKWTRPTSPVVVKTIIKGKI